MTHSLAPETSEQAIALTHALTDIDRAPRLEAAFGPEYAQAVDNAQAWLYLTVNESMPTVAPLPVRNTIDAVRGIDDTSPSINETTLVWGTDPVTRSLERETRKDFNPHKIHGMEAQVAFAALREEAAKKGGAATELLEQISEGVGGTERTLNEAVLSRSRIKAKSAVFLLKLTSLLQ